MPDEDRMPTSELLAYLTRMQKRYRVAERGGRGALLNEMEEMTQLHRKTLIRWMGRPRVADPYGRVDRRHPPRTAGNGDGPIAAGSRPGPPAAVPPPRASRLRSPRGAHPPQGSIVTQRDDLAEMIVRWPCNPATMEDRSGPTVSRGARGRLRASSGSRGR